MRERALAVDLDDGEMLAVPRLECGISGDVDERELEAELVAKTSDHLERTYAQPAVRGVVERDARVSEGYG